MGLKVSPDSPCFFSGTLIPGELLLFITMYVDDFVYYSASDRVEKLFERKLSSACKVDFMGQVAWFLGVHFQWTVTPTVVTAHLSQKAYVESISELFGLSCPLSLTRKKQGKTDPTHQPTPFASQPIDTYAQPDIPNPVHVKRMQELIGFMQWLAQSTRLDIAIFINLLAQYQSNPFVGHLQAAYRAFATLAKAPIGVFSSPQTDLKI